MWSCQYWNILMWGSKSFASENDATSAIWFRIRLHSLCLYASAWILHSKRWFKTCTGNEIVLYTETYRDQLFLLRFIMGGTLLAPVGLIATENSAVQLGRQPYATWKMKERRPTWSTEVSSNVSWFYRFTLLSKGANVPMAVRRFSSFLKRNEQDQK